MTSIGKKNYQRKFYQTLMTLAFFLDTSQYRFISRCIMQFYIFCWMVLVSNNIIVLYTILIVTNIHLIL